MMICVSRDSEIPEIKPIDFCVGCEKWNPEAFNECIKRKGGIRFTFSNGMKITLINRELKYE